MLDHVRNLGRTGVAAYAIAAVDAALWDLEARLLGCPLARLLGQARDRVPLYASGGFTSLAVEELGVTGVLRVDALCSAHDVPLSLHTAPAFHRHLGAPLDSGKEAARHAI